MTCLPMPETPHAAPCRRLARRHVLILILACEVMAVGIFNADRYQPPGIAVEQTVTRGNVIT